MFKEYKVYIIIAALLASYVGVWHVASSLVKAEYIQKELDVVVAVAKANAENQTTKDSIAKVVAESLSKWRPANVIINRKIQNELDKDPVYRDCKSAPSVMHEYQNKLNNQP